MDKTLIGGIIVKKTVFLMLFIGLSLLLVPVNVYSYGTRAIGMGMAYYALSDTANAVFFNPAGLSRFTKGDREVSAMIKINDRELESLDSIAVTGQVTREEQRIKFSISEYLRQDFKPALHEEKLYLNYAIGGLFYRVDTFDEYYKMNSGYIAVGRKIMSEPKLAAGLKLLSSTHDTKGGVHGTELTLGIGLLYDFNKMITIGLVADDVLKNGPFIAPIILNLGILIKLNDSTRIELDGYNLTSENFSWRWRGEEGAEFRIGFEKSFINDTLVVRFGSKNGNLNMGFGVQVTPNFRMDYAMNYDNKSDTLYNPLEYQHFVSANITF